MHLRALRIAYRDYESDFETLLKRDSSVTVHQRNLPLLMVEIYKTKENLNPEFMKDIFITNDMPYSLRSGNSLLQPSARTTNFGIETTPSIGHKLWQMLPNDIKTANSLAVFKNRIKTWKGEKCNCRLCQIFVANLGFLRLRSHCTTFCKRVYARATFRHTDPLECSDCKIFACEQKLAHAKKLVG